jgi:hypothetical protein
MGGKQKLAKTVFFPLFVLGCFIFGWMIPNFYDWSGANQSRSSPAFDEATWSLLGFGVLSWLFIPWLPMKEPSLDDAKKPFQFNLRMLLAVTTIVAIGIASATHFTIAFCISLWVIAFVATSRMVAKDLTWRRQLAALLACMYFPYVWTLFPGTFKGLSWTIVFNAVGLPTFFPTFFLCGFFGTRSEEMVWLWILLTLVEVAIGAWLIRTGARRTITYFVVVMLMSIYGSMFLNALVRM